MTRKYAIIVLSKEIPGDDEFGTYQTTVEYEGYSSGAAVAFAKAVAKAQAMPDARLVSLTIVGEPDVDVCVNQ